MIRAICFDLDGVLTREKSGSVSIGTYISKAANVPFEQFMKVYYTFNQDLLQGNYTHQEMWKKLCCELGYEIPYALLQESFIHTPIDTDMLDLAKRWEAKVKIGMITDNKVDRIESIIAANHWEELFDTVTISAGVHAQKTEAKCFLHTFEQLAVKPNETIFIDNTRENLIVPARLGVHTYFFDDQIRDMKALDTFIQNKIEE